MASKQYGNYSSLVASETGYRSSQLSNNWAHWYGWGVDSKAPSFQNEKTGIYEQKYPENRYGTRIQRHRTAIARALRDNLERIQRSSEELHHSVNDVVAACGSNKPTNALPSLLRAQTSAAALAASLEVLSRFITVSMQSGQRSPFEAQITELVGKVAAQPPCRAPTPAVPPQPVPMASKVHSEPEAEEPVETEFELHPEPGAAPADGANRRGDRRRNRVWTVDFNVSRLSPEEQELHRRANRVAKVSMQDIKMLRPEQVRLGREKKDLCIRLKDDIEKAHREYDRRFKPIMDHPSGLLLPLDGGNPRRWRCACLGDYPYATPSRPSLIARERRGFLALRKIPYYSVLPMPRS